MTVFASIAPGDVALLVTAVGGLVLGLLSWRNSSSQEKRATEAARVDTRLKETDQSITALSEALEEYKGALQQTKTELASARNDARAEMARAEERCAEEIAEIRRDHAASMGLMVSEHHAALEERDRRHEVLREEVKHYRHETADCKAGLTAAKAIISQMDKRIVELGGQPLGIPPTLSYTNGNDTPSEAPDD